MTRDYVHGYDKSESVRLQDQARTLEALLHADTHYPPGSRVLEAGCGVGAQSVTLARSSPGAAFTAIDISVASLAEATARAAAAGLSNIRFETADLFDAPFAEGAFDHAFVCFVLEHLPQPELALTALRRLLRPGGTITVIEGDHGSAVYHPATAEATAAVAALVEMQRRAGGDAMIGRRLYPLLASARFDEVRISPRLVYADASRPDLVEGFTRKTFNAMVEGVRDQAIAAGVIEPDLFDAGLADLDRTARADGTFSYTFYKAVAVRPVD